MKKSGNSHHVVPHDDSWAVRRANSERISQSFDTQKEAIERGRDISRNQKTELIIHSKDGLINRRDSHGHDPYPPKG